MKLINHLKEGLYLRWLLWETRKERINRELARLAAGSSFNKKANCRQGQKAKPKLWQLDEVTVGAVQGKLQLVSRVEEYVAQMYFYTEEAVRQGAQLLVFPEDNGAHLVGLLPGIGELELNQDIDAAIKDMGGGAATVADIFRYLGPVTNQVFHHTFSRLAKLFNVYLMPGSVIIPNDKGQVVNQAFLYSPEGKLIGSQTKTHLLPMEGDWGLSCGQELNVFDTPLGKLAFPVCMDASYYETFRILSLMGAEIILLPIANPEEYNYYKALRGIWPRVQENLVYGVKSALVGQALGLTLTGKAGIYGPLELTEKQDGVIKESSNHNQEEVVIATLNLKALRQKRAAAKNKEMFNTALYAKYFPKLYREFQA